MIWPSDAQITHYVPMALDAGLFMLVGGWRWLNTDKHYGPWHRWLLMTLGGVFVALMLHWY